MIDWSDFNDEWDEPTSDEDPFKVGRPFDDTDDESDIYLDYSDRGFTKAVPLNYLYEIDQSKMESPQTPIQNRKGYTDRTLPSTPRSTGSRDRRRLASAEVISSIREKATSPSRSLRRSNSGGKINTNSYLRRSNSEIRRMPKQASSRGRQQLAKMHSDRNLYRESKSPTAGRPKLRGRSLSDVRRGSRRLISDTDEIPLPPLSNVTEDQGQHGSHRIRRVGSGRSLTQRQSRLSQSDHGNKLKQNPMETTDMERGLYTTVLNKESSHSNLPRSRSNSSGKRPRKKDSLARSIHKKEEMDKMIDRVQKLYNEGIIHVPQMREENTLRSRSLSPPKRNRIENGLVEDNRSDKSPRRGKLQRTQSRSFSPPRRREMSRISQHSNKYEIALSFHTRNSIVSQVLNEGLEEIEKKKKDDLKRLRADFAVRKKHMDLLHQQKLKEMKEKVKASKEIDPSIYGKLKKLKDDLEKERGELLKEKKRTKDLVISLKKENDEQQAVNDEIFDMYNNLSEFVKRKTLQNEKLTSSLQQLTKIYNGARLLRIESYGKNIYRKAIYKISDRVRSSDLYDWHLDNDTMDLIRECEEGLNSTVLTLEEVEALDHHGPDDPSIMRITFDEDESNHDEDVYTVPLKSILDEEGGESSADFDDATVDRSIDEASREAAAFSNAFEEVLHIMDEQQKSTLYENKDMLLSMFRFLDTDGDGQINLDEFEAGIDFMNKRLPESSHFKDYFELFKAMDKDNNGVIDIDEFSQIFVEGLANNR